MFVSLYSNVGNIKIKKMKLSEYLRKRPSPEVNGFGGQMSVTFSTIREWQQEVRALILILIEFKLVNFWLHFHVTKRST